ncbi:MAG: sugar ABC transporter substrate-binding protein [Rhodobacteraceae bacterium]|nr:sugar ABC transporter substrate-binding protein [Paracoccaceae bacterium]
MKNLIKSVAIASVVTIASFASPVFAEGEKYIFIYHSPDSDSWWNVIKNAIGNAEDDLGVTVDIRNPPTGDIADMARLVQQSIASDPDGLVVTIADYDALSGPIRDAVDAGIPVITVNSGTPAQSAELGAMLHIGQPEFDAGFAAGSRAKADGIGNFVCVNHQINNAPLIERCRGFAEALGVELGNSMIDVGIDPSEVKNRVIAYLRTNPDVEAILGLGPNASDPTIAALEEIGMAGEIYFGTFDMSDAIADAIKAGTIQWAIDQQPYLQGYLPISFLTMFSRYGVQIPHNVNSGPGFITSENIELVATMAGVYR